MYDMCWRRALFTCVSCVLSFYPIRGLPGCTRGRLVNPSILDLVSHEQLLIYPLMWGTVLFGILQDGTLQFMLQLTQTALISALQCRAVSRLLWPQLHLCAAEAGVWAEVE